MSSFVDTLVGTATGVEGTRHGMVTGFPATPTRRSWAVVHQRACSVAGALRDLPVERGDAVAVLAAEPELVAAGAQGVWLAGGSVTMLHQPTARTDLVEWAGDTLRVLDMIGSRVVLLGAPFTELAATLDEYGIDYRLLGDLLSGHPIAEPVESDEDDTALLQLTSGSTAEPKAVRITHRNLISNATAMARRVELETDTDVMVSWLPTFHDMGMVGFLTMPMLFGVELVKATPAVFLAQPLRWVELISAYGGTITAAPNFAYAIVGRRMAGVDDTQQYDLSALRVALNGAEPIDEQAVATFVAAAGRFGMSAAAVFPAYGMAEATLGVAFAPLSRGLAVDPVLAGRLATENTAVPVGADGPSHDTESVRSLIKLGPVLPGIEIGVRAQDGHWLAEREVGEIQLRGAAVTPGYITVDGPVVPHDEHGWLPTGDLGYLAEGEVVVCGRLKDVIITAGRNIYPTDVERAAAAVDGVRPGNVVAVRLAAGTGRERFAVVLESARSGNEEAEASIVRTVSARVHAAVQLRPYSVVVLPPGSLPKTPSGKVKRAGTADQYAAAIGTAAAG